MKYNLTILRRLGNKSKIAPEIIKHFPKMHTFIDLFFGGGAMTFEMVRRFPNLNYFANDLDDDVFNLWDVLQHKFDKLYEYLELTPYSRSVFKYYLSNEPKDDIEKAVKFLYLSNYSLYGTMDTLKITYSSANSKQILLENMKGILKYLGNITFENKDVFDIELPLSSTKNRPLLKNGQFIYADPPYVNRSNNYPNSFNLVKLIRLIEKLIDSGLKFCISEFKSDETIALAKKYGLKIIEIKERKTINNRNTEIIMINYTGNTLFND